MKHPTTGQLRAFIDEQLEPGELAHLQAHLDACHVCREQSEDLKQRASGIYHRLEGLDPETQKKTLLPQAALARLVAGSTQPTKEIEPMTQRLFGRRLRPFWTTLTFLTLIVALLFIPSVRAAAINFLGLFRVQTIQVVQFNLADLPQDIDQRMLSLENLIASQVNFEEFGENSTVANETEASVLAGFQVRAPADWSREKSISYSPGAKITFTVDRDLAALVLDELGRADLELPKDFDNAEISVEVSSMVVTNLGTCDARMDPDDPGASGQRASCISLVQMPSPTITAPPGLDIEQIGLVALQLIGLTPEEAAEFSARVDWTTTLVLPVPKDLEYRDVTVDGVPGTLLVDKYRSQSSQFTLLWVKEGMLYGLSGRGSTGEAFQVANSLQ